MSQICCSMYNITEGDGCFWFWAYRENLLCKMKKNSLSVEPVARFKREKKLAINEWGEYRDCHYVEGKIMLIPFGHNDLRVIDISNLEQATVSIPESREEGITKYNCGKVYNNQLYLIPCEKDVIYRVCIKNDDYSIQKIWKANKQMMSWGDVALINGNIVFSSLESNRLFEYNTIEDIGSEYEINEIDYATGVSFVNGKMWIIPKKATAIYTYSCDGNLDAMINSFPNGYICGDWSFYKSIVIGDTLCLLPRDSNMIILINTNTMEIRGIDISKNVNRKTTIGRYMPISHAWEIDGDIVAIVSDEGKIINLTGNTDYRFEILGKPIIEEFDDVSLGILQEENTYYGGLKSFISSIH